MESEGVRPATASFLRCQSLYTQTPLYLLWQVFCYWNLTTSVAYIHIYTMQKGGEGGEEIFLCNHHSSVAARHLFSEYLLAANGQQRRRGECGMTTT